MDGALRAAVAQGSHDRRPVIAAGLGRGRLIAGVWRSIAAAPGSYDSCRLACDSCRAGQGPYDGWRAGPGSFDSCPAGLGSL